MVLTLAVAVSVNHAKVVPTSMTTHMTSAMILVSSARLVALRSLMSLYPFQNFRQTQHTILCTTKDKTPMGVLQFCAYVQSIAPRRMGCKHRAG